MPQVAIAPTPNPNCDLPTKQPLFDSPLLLWSDDECTLDGATYRRVPMLVDRFAVVIGPATDWLISQTTSGKLTQSTVERYAHALRSYWEFLDRRGFKWEKASSKTLRVWRNERVELDKPDSINLRGDVVKWFYVWAQEHGYVRRIVGVTQPGKPPFPIRLIERKGKRGGTSLDVRVKSSRKPRRPIPNFEEVDGLYIRLSARKHEEVAVRDCLIADWAVQTGLRREELLSLKTPSIPATFRMKKLQRSDRLYYLEVTGKGGGTRSVPVLPELLLKTRHYIDDDRKTLRSKGKSMGRDDAIFLSYKTGRRLSLTVVSRLFTQAFGRDTKRKLTLHRLRGRFTSKLMQALLRDEIHNHGLASLREETILWRVAEILGHGDLTSLKYYLNLALDEMEPDVRAAVKASAADSVKRTKAPAAAEQDLAIRLRASFSDHP